MYELILCLHLQLCFVYNMSTDFMMPIPSMCIIFTFQLHAFFSDVPEKQGIFKGFFGKCWVNLIVMLNDSKEERSCKLLLQLQNTISDFNYWKFVSFK
jgi:hypothetical protein